VIVRCICAALNSNGEPDLFFVKVDCPEYCIDSGAHYTAAADAAGENGYDPMLTFDENDPGGRAMLPLFVWDTASVVTIGVDPNDY